MGSTDAMKIKIAVAICSAGHWTASDSQCFAYDFLDCDASCGPIVTHYVLADAPKPVSVEVQGGG